MNMQSIMREAQKMQKDLMKVQEELDHKEYEGNSSLVHVKMNGKNEILSVKIDESADISSDDREMLEDMIMLAVNDAVKKAEKEKEAKLSKFGSLAGLM